MARKVSIFWFRRDLRLEDNAGLYHALKTAKAPVFPLFIFDRQILDDLEDRSDSRVTFIYQEIRNLKQQLEDLNSGMMVYYGDPPSIWKEICNKYGAVEVFYNHDYEPYAKTRDKKIASIIREHGGSFNGYKDQVIFESHEILKDDGDPYVVFTPYKRTWLEKLDSRIQDGRSYYLQSYSTLDYSHKFYRLDRPEQMPTLAEMGFTASDMEMPPREISKEVIRSYGQNRDYPAREGTSRLGIHYRFGTISIREKARKAKSLSETYLSELIWREFYSQILDHFPRVVHESFRTKYDRISWRDADDDFLAWCEGLTGYPMVDAGMRQLNQTGYMHNRVRMISASFLTKHLLIDWRRGEAYFAKKLLDYDLASNNGGWQWSAGCGTDAAPYFRIFNPITQREKYDPDKEYVRQWIPELETAEYPAPIVDHRYARKRCLETFKEALKD